MSRCPCCGGPFREGAQVRRVTTITVLPVHLRGLFTHSQHLVLAALVDAMPSNWQVVLSRRQLMQATGCGRTLVEKTMKTARTIGLTREWMHLPGEDANTIEIVSAEWREWIEARRQRQGLARWQ